MKILNRTQIKQIAYTLITFKNQKAKRILDKHQITPDVFFDLSTHQYQVFGFDKDAISHIKQYEIIAEEELDLAFKHEISLIFQNDDCFPHLLRHIYQPPLFIYVKGDTSILNCCKLAVIGSRKCTSYGKSVLIHLLPDIIRHNIIIVSGMAYGIDSIAHQIALQENGYTIGINGGGLLHLYPAGNSQLITKIANQGCIISEFPLTTRPAPYLFPIRNRIIAGISSAILIAEAAMRSGSLITARLALDQNKDIFSIPGSIFSTASQGTHYLIQQGAKLVMKSADILEEMGFKPIPETKKTYNFTTKESLILELIGDGEAIDIDHIVEKSSLSTAETLSILIGLVLKNVIMKDAGGYRRIQ
jgi:DNA processing protein